MKRLKENSPKKHILIVGAGIIGKFNALELSRLGYQVTVADPNQNENCSNAALGILMGNIYQKRSGRSWMLRERSIELWPKWIKYLKEFNTELNIEKPLIQLTTNEEKFEKLKRFASKNASQNLSILEEDSKLIKNISEIFKTKNINGIISYEDGRVNPISLLKTLDISLKKEKVTFLKDEIINIKKFNRQWISTSQRNNEIKSDGIILCNSLKAVDLIDKKYDLKLKPVLGQAIELYIDEQQIDFLSLPKHFSINGTNIITINKNKIIIGSTDEFNTNPEKYAFERLTDFLDKKPDWLHKEKITNKWFGIRSQPVGEPSPIMRNIEKGLLLCTGFYKNGFLLAPACSNWASNILREEIH